MLDIELKKKFTKDLKKHILNQKIELEVFDLVVENSRNQIPLDKRFKDHSLSGTCLKNSLIQRLQTETKTL